MSTIRVSQTKERLERDGKPWFYFADTIWSAFSNVSDDEWQEYLQYRSLQGFNALQINILTVWDAGDSNLKLYPFDRDSNGHFKYDRINEKYFERAVEMVRTAVQKGFAPSLALLWCNYVPGTWATERYPHYKMPFEDMQRYAEYAIKAFAPFKPIYMASGDTDFITPEATSYYRRGMELIRKFSPESLITMHLSPSADVPEELARSSLLDFYMYQSGHGIESGAYAYQLAEKFRSKTVKRPVLNGELCYEGYALGNNAAHADYGKITPYLVRKGIWQSLLSGANAGVTYGAQGVWGWYTDGKKFLNEANGGMALPWRRALQFPGAWDAAYARWICDTYGLLDMQPVSLVRNKTKEVRMSMSSDRNRFALYSPFNSAFEIAMDLSDFSIFSIDLESRRVIRPQVTCDNGASLIHLHDFNADALIIGRRN